MRCCSLPNIPRGGRCDGRRRGHGRERRRGGNPGLEDPKKFGIGRRPRPRLIADPAYQRSMLQSASLAQLACALGIDWPDGLAVTLDVPSCQESPPGKGMLPPLPSGCDIIVGTRTRHIDVGRINSRHIIVAAGEHDLEDGASLFDVGRVVAARNHELPDHAS